ncbi:MAG: DNA mismatch repair protein MutL, partial [Ruminococcus sp.]|nr:DNA mismatch repair protein MutL [Ruminococcus sp.]
DLDSISTLGFRGEALASVSAVSKVEVMTKQREETYGTIYNIEGSQEISHEKGGCPDGTTIIIRDLFYNVPARAKFMKKDVTEANAVSNIVQKITLSHPEVSFRMIRDNRLEFNSAGDGELFSAVYAVYGRDFARDLIPCDYEHEGVHVSGFVIKPLYSKNNRAFQNFFVNGRYVRSRICSSALENAYSNLIMTGKFPACVLMIDLFPSAMDVNIHPSKAEVRFTDEKKVTDAVYFAVKNALMNDGLIYEFELKKPAVDWTAPAPVQEELPQQSFFTPVDQIARKEQEMSGKPEVVGLNGFEGYAKERTPDPEPVKFFATPEPTGDPFANSHKAQDIAVPAPVESKPIPEEMPPDPEEAENDAHLETAPIEGFKYLNQSAFTAPAAPVNNVPQTPVNPLEEEFPDLRLIGEAFGLYVIAESGHKLVIIDKHAAHERIIFERLMSRNCRQFSQTLLTGVKVLLTADQFSAVEENQELLADLGFTFDLSDAPCVTATAVPTFIMELDMEEIVCEVAENLRLHKVSPQSGQLDDIFHTVACKAAIKGGDRNSPEELLSLVKQVCYDEKIRHCPHGRPVMFTMTKSSMDHQFKRT